MFKKYFSTITTASTLMLLAPSINAEDSNWYDQSFEDILNSRVTTATRNESTIKDAPGVTTVYNAEDIERMGLRSVKELLERTTGFFVNRQLTGATVGSRGNIADTDQFLMLIDGHSINSIVTKGMGETFLLPNLEHVKRVEILRGPGSTLWGSDAALGIINIITKDGADIDGTQLTANYSSEDGAQHVNMQTGKAITDDIDFMASITAIESDGFDIKGLGGQSLDFGNWDAWKDSYELYAKAKTRNYTLSVRAADTKISRPFIDLFSQADGFTSGDYPTYNHRTHYYIDLTHIDTVAQDTTLETRFFSDNLKQTQVLVEPRLAPNIINGYASQSSEENALGLEMIVRSNYFEHHAILAGFRKVRTQLAPVIDKLIYPIETTVEQTSGSVNFYAVPDDIDDSTAFFIEDVWSVIPNKLNVIAGIRRDSNNLREDKDIILPRFAAHWQVIDALQIKYSYDTGYIRPSVGIGFLGQELIFQDTDKGIPPQKRIGVKKSQEISSHNLQFVFSKDAFYGSFNVYRTEVDNPFQLLFEGTDTNASGFDDVIAFYVNTNAIVTQGAELELAYKPRAAFDIYGSLAIVQKAEIHSMTGSSGGLDYDLNNTTATKFDFNTFSYDSQIGFAEGSFTPDGRVSPYPHLMLQLGVNYEFAKNITSNIHARYWDDMQVRAIEENDKSSDKTVSLNGQLFVDLNLRWEQILGSEFDASLFVKNLLDNDDAETYMYLYQNVWREQGRRVGGSLAYSW